MVGVKRWKLSSGLFDAHRWVLSSNSGHERDWRPGQRMEPLMTNESEKSCLGRTVVPYGVGSSEKEIGTVTLGFLETSETSNLG